MTRDEMLEIARANVDRHLGDCVDADAETGDVQEEVYTLAFDALADAGVDHETAGDVASEVARGFA